MNKREMRRYKARWKRARRLRISGDKYPGGPAWQLIVRRYLGL